MSLRDFQSWGLDTSPPEGWIRFGGTTAISTTGGRFSDGCLTLSQPAWVDPAPAGLRRTFDAQRTWFIGVPLKIASLRWDQTFLGLLSGIAFQPGLLSSYQVLLSVGTSGFIEARRGDTNGTIGTLLGTGTHTITCGGWYFVELAAYIDNAAGTLQVYVNGMLDIDLSGVDTQGQATDTADVIVLGGNVIPPLNVEVKLGQVYICDDQGGENNSLLGDCHVIVQVPTGDGTYSDWTPSTGGTQYELVDEIPPDGGTTYVSSNTLNAMDTFTFDDIGASGTVIAVKVCIDAEKDEVGVRTIAPVIRQLGTDYTYADIYPSAASYGKFTEMFTVRPSDSNPWQVSDLGSGGAEFGVVVTG